MKREAIIAIGVMAIMGIAWGLAAAAMFEPPLSFGVSFLGGAVIGIAGMGFILNRGWL